VLPQGLLAPPQLQAAADTTATNIASATKYGELFMSYLGQ
jgi:hypothetical protein